jgi:hypothetical protein
MKSNWNRIKECFFDLKEPGLARLPLSLGKVTLRLIRSVPANYSLMLRFQSAQTPFNTIPAQPERTRPRHKNTKRRKSRRFITMEH